MNSPKYTRNRRWAKENPEKYERIRKRAKLKWTYGITLEEFEALIVKQQGKCAICGASDDGDQYKGLRVDHCHDTKKVRGLLCGKCNQGLGMFNENSEALKSAINYLRRHNR